MVWFRIDDVFPFHERIIRAGNAAVGVWSRAGAWSAAQLTDGFVPTEIARTIGSAKEIRRLVDVGLWIEEDGGYRFHAWAEDGTGTKRQPTRAEVEAKRRAEAERKAAYRSKQERAVDGRYEPQMSQRDTRGTDGGTPAGVPPLPTRPDPYTPLAPLGGSAPPVDNPGEKPAAFCPKHPTGTDRACRACGNARRAHDDWTPPAAPPRAPRWDPATHCEHGQLLGACDACDYETAHVAEILHGRWGTA
jgi:hypothetical protein